MQIVFRYGFLKLQNIPLALSDFNYALLVLSTVLIAAAGYIINNIFDQETDSINKPNAVVVGKSITENTAYNLYILLNVSGVGIGFYLSNVISKPGFAAIFIVIAATLYIYATSLKQMMLVGNLIVAALLSISILIIGVFDLFPVTNASNQQLMGSLFSILLDYAIFSFLINFIREIIKDIEDVNGDYNQGMTTLPIVLGITRTLKVVFVFSFVPLLLLLFYIKNYLVANDLYIATAFALLLIVAPILYFIIQLLTAKNTKDYHAMSTLLKWILFTGILSIFIITLNINYNA
jgi:4-hydroxybenzoate polyprenyltransferase